MIVDLYIMFVGKIKPTMLIIERRGVNDNVGTSSFYNLGNK